MPDIAKAYVQIVPTTEGIGNNLTEALGGVANDAGKSAGDSFTGAFSSALKVGATAIAATATAVIGATVAMVDGVAKTAEYGDQIDKTSQQLGVSAQFYQEWDAVLQHSGTSMDAMGATFTKLANAVQDGSDDQIAAFEALGLSMDDLQGMSTEEVFTATITALQGMEEGTERTALATELLGRGAQNLGALLNTSAEDTQAMIDAVNELGGVMSDEAVSASADFQDSLQNMQTSMNGLKNNALAQFLPAFTTMMDGISAVMSGDGNGMALFQQGVEQFAQSVGESLPQMLEFASQLLIILAEAITESAPALLSAGFEIVKSIGSSILESLPMLFDVVVGLINTIISEIRTNLDSIINSGVELLLSLASGLIDALPELIIAVIDIVMAMAEKLTEPDTLQKLIEAAFQIMFAIAEGLLRSLPRIIEAVKNVGSNILTTLGNLLAPVLQIGKDIIEKIKTGLNNKLQSLRSGISGIVTNVLTWFKNIPSSIVEVGKNIIVGLWNGINDKVTWIKNKITGFAESVLDTIKDFFGIASPSKLFRDDVGKWIPEGMAVGIEANADSVTDAMDQLGNTTLDAGIDSVANMNTSFGANAGSSNSDIYGLLARYLPSLADGRDMNISIDADAEGIFRIVRDQNRIYTKSTGRSAFA